MGRTAMITNKFMLEADTDRSDLEQEIAFQQRKQQIHASLVESLDLAAVQRLDDPEVCDQIAEIAWQTIDDIQPDLSPEARQRMHRELQHELFGMGPLEPLFADPMVSDILVNGPHEVIIERYGQLSRTNVVFADRGHLMRIIQRVVSRMGRRIDEVNPLVDARMEDGSRINAVIPPLAVDGPKLSIRRFIPNHFALQNLVLNDSLSGEMAEFLKAAVAARVSLLISGGTGAGKTTLLDAVSIAVPRDERLVTIEDSAELVLQHPHVVRLETRPANHEGSGEYSQRDLVRNSLRMRPDRIIIGEVRGAEALDMLQAMNSGHEGSLTTIHANDAHDALARLEMMVAMTGFELPIPVVRQYIASGIGLVVHLARLKGGVRRVMRICEIRGIIDGQFDLQDVFRFRQRGIDEQGRARGQFESEGYRPNCLGRFEELGVELDPSIFTPVDGSS